MQSQTSLWSPLGASVLLTLAMALAAGCNYNDVKNQPANRGRSGSPLGAPEAVVDYATVRAQVFVPHCFKCHSSETKGGPKDGVNLETYALAFPHAADIRTSVDLNDMPKRAPPLSSELKALLFAWIDSGAPEKSTLPTKAPTDTPPTRRPPAAPPVTPPAPNPQPNAPPVAPPSAPPVAATPPDYGTVRALVFVPHCLKCHSSATEGGPKGKVNLETYTEAIKAGTDLIDVLVTDDMPKKAPALHDDLKKLVFAWVDGGMPEAPARPAEPNEPIRVEPIQE